MTNLKSPVVIVSLFLEFPSNSSCSQYFYYVILYDTYKFTMYAMYGYLYVIMYVINNIHQALDSTHSYVYLFIISSSSSTTKVLK